MAASEELDLELIAAFIDGRLTGAERERVIGLLGESEAAFEIYADALRARADLGEAKVIPIDNGRRRNMPPWRTIASVAAAAVLVIAVLPVIRGRQTQADFRAPSSQIAMALERRTDLAQSLPADWDQPRWPVTRGERSHLADTAIAFRLGVRSVDLRVAIAAGDKARADRLMGEIIETLDGTEASNSVKAEYAGLRAQLARGEAPAQLAASAEHAETEAERLFEPFWFAFGRWLGAGEVAAATQSKEFFTDPRTTRILNMAAERRELAPDDAALLRDISRFAAHGGDDFNTIRQHFQTLIRRHGG